MPNPRMLSGLIVLLLIAAGVAIPPKSASAQEQTPTTTAPADAPVKKSGRMDPKHPLHIGVNYHPKKSLRNREQGVGQCLLL